MCSWGDSDFLLLNTCSQMTTKLPQILILGLQINFSKLAHLQIQNLQIIRINCISRVKEREGSKIFFTCLGWMAGGGVAKIVLKETCERN